MSNTAQIAFFRKGIHTTVSAKQSYNKHMEVEVISVYALAINK